MSDEVHPADAPAESVPQRSGPLSLLKKVFVGPHGLRAGWKVLIFFLIVFAVGFLLRPLNKLTGKPAPKLPGFAPGAALIGELRGMAAVLIATAIMAKWISIARFELREEGCATRLVFDHTGFPAGKAEHLADGWKTNYWEPMRKYLDSANSA